MKVERVSYDVMTPSAARAVFEAILWKPAIQWVVERIEVMRPIRWTSVRRNEVASKAVVGKHDFFVEENRQQRAGLILRDVCYRIHGHMQLKPGAGEGNGPAKFMEMFERRAAKGQCVMQPYLGCREFSAYFEWLPEGSDGAAPISETRDLSLMLYDLAFRPKKEGAVSFKGETGVGWGTVTGEAYPLFFRARLEGGVLSVPAPDSAEVLQ
jgi:CRISPR-associated protein Cas5d